MSPRLRALLLVGLAAVAVAGIAWLGTWAVEDAAISWAYAENIASGLGPVPWAGAEPVEGYSNPTWVAALALGALLGLHPLWGSKLLAMALTGGTVVLVYRLGRQVVPDAPETGGLVAAALFAVNSQVAIYGAAGLENPLFNLLLAAALVRLFHEQTEGGPPWSAIWLALLAATRPDGIAHGVLIGLLTTLARARRGTDRVEIARWWLALLGPLFAYNLGRWAYFGWELPSTAYAKISDGYEHLWLWRARGWVYTREWAAGTGQVWFGWLYLLALLGARRRALLLTAVLVGTGAALYLTDVNNGWFNLARTAYPLLVGAGLWLGTSRRDDRGTLLAVSMGATFFAIWARGDWMAGGRWFAMLAVPASALLAAGICTWLQLLRHPRLAPVRTAVAAVLVVAFAIPQGLYVHRFLRDGAEISPWIIRDRVWAAQQILSQVQHDQRGRVLTVDMGAFLMWSGMECMDVVGLTDVPMAQHRGQPTQQPFFAEYILEEKRPDILFLGTIEATLTHIPGFTDTYLQTHKHWRIRKDLLFGERWDGPEGRRVDFDGTTLVGWEIPAQPTVAGSAMYLELALDNRDRRALDWHAFLVDEDGQRAAHWKLPLYGPDTQAWPDDELYLGKVRLDLPEDLGPGHYRLGFAMRTFDAFNGADPDTLPAGAHLVPDGAEPYVMPGEVLFDEGLTVAPREQVEPLVQAQQERALAQAAEGDCKGARRTWFVARRQGLGDIWAEARDPELTRAFASCWLGHALQATGAERIDLLERARRLDPAAPGLHDALQAEADRLQATGDAAREEKRDKVAYAAYRDALRLDPYRPWLRRYAEEARRRRLWP